MRYLLAALIGGLALHAPAAPAQTPVSYVEDGRALFTVSVPDFWSVRTGGPRVLTLPETDAPREIARLLALQPTTDSGVWMGLLSPRGVATTDEARDYLAEVARFLAFDPEVGPPSARRIGGRPAETFSGTGRRDGKALRFTVAMIDLPGDRVAIAAAIVEAGADPGFIPVLNDVFASFRAE